MYQLYWPNILFEISRSFPHSSMRGYGFRLMTSQSVPLSGLLTMHTKSICNEMPLKNLRCGNVCNIYRDKWEEIRCYLSEDTVRGTGKKACSLLKFMEPGTRMKQWTLVSFGSCLSVSRVEHVCSNSCQGERSGVSRLHVGNPEGELDFISFQCLRF